MTFRFIRDAAFFATVASIVGAQSIVPQDLQTGFSTSGVEVQVSYTGEAVNGFADGTKFEKNAVTKEPTFALGDSSGITPSTLYTILMVDTTCPNARKLHYARSNFKNNFDITNIDTKSAAFLDYKAPGSLGEAGDNRQYSFLMYTQTGRATIDKLKLPADGDTFNAKQFQDDNGLGDPDAGVGMVVKLGGTADCGSDTPTNLPDNLPSSQPPQISKAPTSNAGQSSAASSTSASQQASSGASATPTQVSSLSSAPLSSSPNSRNSSSVASVRSSALLVTSTVQPTNAPGPSTIVSTIILSRTPGAEGTARTPTTSAGLQQQSGNPAPRVAVLGGLAIAPVFAAAGVLFI